MDKTSKVTIRDAIILMIAVMIGLLGCCAGCSETPATNGTTNDITTTQAVAANLSETQPTPKDIDYSIERYNLIRRAYWVNGQREKANALACPVDKPLGYIVLFAESGAVVNRFVVDGKVTSLNSYLTPDSEYYEINGASSGNRTWKNKWLADVDGSYGENDNGIFFFTPDGSYVEWTGTYLYSDIPMKINNPVVQIGGEGN